MRELDAEKRARAKDLLEESFSMQAIENKVIETYCSLYRKLRGEGVQLPDADLLIAATAISNNMTLKTRDEHFKRLKKHVLKITI